MSRRSSACPAGRQSREGWETALAGLRLPAGHEYSGALDVLQARLAGGQQPGADSGRRSEGQPSGDGGPLGSRRSSLASEAYYPGWAVTDVMTRPRRGCSGERGTRR